MAPKGYDRFMIATRIGTDRKVRRLPEKQRWCFVAGILALAAESPVRGWLFIQEEVPATEQDIAYHATTSVGTVRATIKALESLRVVEWDAQFSCWMVPDFEDWNPDPAFIRNDPTAAERQRRYREARRLRNVEGDVTSDVTVTSTLPGEVRSLGKGETPPPCPPKGGRARDRERWRKQLQTFAAEQFPAFSAKAVEQAVVATRSAGTREAVAAHLDKWFTEAA